MRNLSIKKKSILLGVVPLLVVTMTITGVDIWRMIDQRSEEIERYRTEQLETKRNQLKEYVQMALSSISDLYEQGGQNARKEAINTLSKLRYGKNGYISVFNSSGVVLANPGFPEFVGKNTWDKKDPKGRYTARGIIQAAISGDGYHLYEVPTKMGGYDKLTHSLYLPEWDWVIGTGFLINDVDEAVALIENRFRSDMFNYAVMSAIISLICLVLAAIVAVQVANSMIRPLNYAVEAMNDIAAGEGDLTRRLDITGDNEVAALAEGFNAFAEKIQGSIHRVAEASKIILESVDDLEKIAQSNDNRVSLLRQEKDKIVTEITEMSATAQEVAKSAGEAANATSQTDEETSNARMIVNGAVETAKVLVSEVGTAASVIDDLKQEAVDISSVTNVIQEISEQTNLLALNAAIEAARAGEQGRGFAVVADEVRNLANNTQQSTQKIQEMIQRLQDGTQKAVTAMEDSRAKSQNTMESSQEANGHLQTVASYVSTINDMNSQIAKAADEQSQVSEEINKNIIRISDIIEESAQDIHATSTAGEKLAHHGHQLQDLVDQFKH